MHACFKNINPSLIIQKNVDFYVTFSIGPHWSTPSK